MGEDTREKVHWRRSTREVSPKVTKKVGCRKTGPVGKRKVT